MGMFAGTAPTPAGDANPPRMGVERATNSPADARQIGEGGEFVGKAAPYSGPSIAP